MRRPALAIVVLLAGACGSRLATPEPRTTVAAAPATDAPTGSVIVERPPPVAPPSVAAVDPCAVAQRRTAEEVARAHAAPGGTAPALAPFFESLDALERALDSSCTPTMGGAWALVLTGTTLPPAEAETTCTVHVAFVDAAGVVHLGNDELGWTESAEMEGHGSVHFDRFFDFDGDGTSEAIVQLDTHYYEDETHRTFLVAHRDGAVGPYPPAVDIDVHEVVDVDADGRPDLVSIRRYWSGSDCGDEPPLEGTPAVLFHALPNGEFSATDDVAKTYLRTACPAAPARLLGTDWPCGEQEARHAIACARIWGASADAVRTRLHAERARLSATARALGEWDALDAYAGIDPPVVLP